VRNRYVDLVRLVAILVVVVGHWLDTTILITDGKPVGESALAVVGYLRWLTLLLQVMPLFFLAGGYAAAASWPSWTARGGRWAGWTHGRFARLLRPTSWFVAIMAALAGAVLMLRFDPSVVAQAGWGVALQLWFLPVYMLLLVLAVPLLAAWNRFGWPLLVFAIGLVAGIDVLLRLGRLEVVGWASYLLAPAAAFVLGMAWRAGALRRRAVPIAMLLGGGLTLLVLVAVFDYPPWMIGVPGEPTSNTSPPNLALMAYSAAQIGGVLLLEPPIRRWLQRPRVWTAVIRGNAVIMTLYLWHMVPVLILAPLMIVARLLPGPQAGTLAWWGTRVFWIGALALLLAGLVGLVGRFERPQPARVGLAGWTASGLLLLSAALTGYALFRLALGGFAPAGQVAVGALSIYAAGVLAWWLAGRPLDPASRAGAPTS
jgi:fucose 4-O-acetylase-like acetyltransferase